MNKLKNSTDIPKKEINVDELAEQARKLTERKTGGKTPTAPTMETEVKINILLPKSKHWKFKTHCLVNGTNMQETARDVLLNWLEKQPNLL